jgi:hypothetical protein
MYKKVLITALIKGLIKGLIKKSFIILVLPCSTKLVPDVVGFS